MIDTIFYGDTPVPIPTSEVGIVSQALQTFIVSPKRHMRMTPQMELVTPHITSVCISTNIVTYVICSILTRDVNEAGRV